MAPSYTPNKIPGMALPSSLLKYEEPQQLQDIMHQQALQRAQQLKTQQDEIATQQKQQAFDQENRMREGIQSEFQDGSDFDPGRGLEVAKRIAFENGDLDSALQIERVQNQRKDLTPYSADQANAIAAHLGITLPESPEGYTKEFVRDLISADRTNFARDRWNDQSQFGSPEWELSEGARGDPRLDREFKKAEGTNLTLNGLIDELDSSVAMTGSSVDPSTPEFQRQKQLIALLATEMKNMRNFGANFTALEARLNQGSLPQLFADPNVPLSEALYATGLGRDPRTAIAELKRQLNFAFENDAYVRNYKRRGSQGGMARPTLNPSSGGSAVDAAVQRGTQSQGSNNERSQWIQKRAAEIKAQRMAQGG